MFLKDLARIIYVEGTASENRLIKVVTETIDGDRTLWEGIAKELKHSLICQNEWIVVEILVNRTKYDECDLPDENKSKIIRVI